MNPKIIKCIKKALLGVREFQMINDTFRTCEPLDYAYRAIVEDF